jgi:hypothetical protein
MKMKIINRDICCGLLFVVVGVLFGYQSLFYLPLGTLRSMGPGFFPTFLSAATVVVGLVVGVSGVRKTADGVLLNLPWRALLAILAGPLVFGLLISPLGLVPSILVLAAIAAAASSKTSLLSAAGISVSMVVICTAIFVFGLGIPIPMFGTLLTNP